MLDLGISAYLSYSQYFSVYLSYILNSVYLSYSQYFSVFSIWSPTRRQGPCCKADLQLTEEILHSKQLAACRIGGSQRAAGRSRPHARHRMVHSGDTLPF